jgi:hypothetical protein
MRPDAHSDIVCAMAALAAAAGLPSPLRARLAPPRPNARATEDRAWCAAPCGETRGTANSVPRHRIAPRRIAAKRASRAGVVGSDEDEWSSHMGKKKVVVHGRLPLGERDYNTRRLS